MIEQITITNLTFFYLQFLNKHINTFRVFKLTNLDNDSDKFNNLR